MRVDTGRYEILGVLEGGDALHRIEDAGRICYQSSHKITDTSAPRFAELILRRGHESVLEHVSVSVRIVCDRGVSHEIVRHRLASYSQESTRYCNYSKDQFGGEITVIEPPGLDGHASELWEEAMVQAESAYMRLLDAKVPPEIARSVLPTCLKTELVMTCNIREWRHFFELRTSNKAHPQMVLLARPMLAEFRGLFSPLFDDVGATTAVEAQRREVVDRVATRIKRRGLELDREQFLAMWDELQAARTARGLGR